MSQAYFNDVREFTEEQIGCMKYGLNPYENFNRALIIPIIESIRQDLKTAFSYYEKKFKEFDPNFKPKNGIYPIALKELIIKKEFLIFEKEEFDGDKGLERRKIRSRAETSDERRIGLEREDQEEREFEQGVCLNEAEFSQQSKEALSKLSAHERLRYTIRKKEYDYRFHDKNSIEYRTQFPEEQIEEMIFIENEYLKLKEALLCDPGSFRYSRYEVYRWFEEHQYIPEFKFGNRDKFSELQDYEIFYLNGDIIGIDNLFSDMNFSNIDDDLQQQPNRIIHSTKGKRRDILTMVIEQAQRKCKNPLDVFEVWATLLEMASNMTTLFRGLTEDGLKYVKADDQVAFLTLEALRKRLRRQQPPVDANPV